jgi:CHAT domain-containing protein
MKFLIALAITLLLLPTSIQSRTPAHDSRLGWNEESVGAQQITSLEVGRAITTEISGEQEHNYQLVLPEGQYARVIVDQRGVDISVRLLGPRGELIANFNDEYRSQGEEKVEVVAESGGTYRLIVRATSRSAPIGQYEIRATELRTATSDDRLLQEARKLKYESGRALRAGDYEGMRKFSERAIAISEKVLGQEDPFVASMLVELAMYHSEKQEFAKELAVAKRIQYITEKAYGPEHPRTIEANRRLAFVYYSLNETANAEPLAERTVEQAEKVLGAENYLLAHSLFTLAKISRDSKKAEQLLKRALSMAEKTRGEKDYLVTVILDEIGVFYLDLGQYQQAEPYVLRSKALKEQTLGVDQMGMVINLNNLGWIARLKKDYGAAETNYQRAIAIVEKKFGADNPRVAEILNNLANIFRATGDYAKSLESHLRVLRIAEATKGPYHPLTLTSLGNIARTYAAQGNLADAVRYQARVDAVIERNIDLNLAVGSERRKVSYLNSMAERTDRTISLAVDLAPNEAEAGALAALVLLQRKGRLQDAMSRSFAALHQRSTPEQRTLLERLNNTTAQLAALVLNGPQGLSVEEHRQRIQELEEEKEKLETEISSRIAEFRAQSQPVTLTAVQAAIPLNAALIEFAVYRPFDPKAQSNSEAYKERHYAVCVLRHTGEPKWKDLGAARGIDAAVAALRKALSDPLRSDVRTFSRALDEQITKPVRGYIGNATHLIVSPDGELNLIPFEALSDEQGRYLIQSFRFTYLTSGRDLLRLQVPSNVQNASIVIANPFFGEPEASSKGSGSESSAENTKRGSVTIAEDMSRVYFAPLTGTAQEAKTIGSLLKNVNTFLGVDATESSLKKTRAPQILHIATHGFFLTSGPTMPANPASATRAISATVRIENPLLRSGLALAGANLRQTGDDDGILTALEASGLNLWGTKLVTLSACDTGLGEVRTGEGVYGLRRAFVLAGSESLVMSLWPVSDYVTRELMAGFYKGLTESQGRGEALRHAQLEFLRKKDRRHPFYWASFIQSGEWANLDGRR